VIACDTSVLVAAFARWHDSHAIATSAILRLDALIDHTVIETFAVLTRLPAPRRAPAELVTAFLDHHFPAGTPRLQCPGSAQILARAQLGGVAGGAVYDLLVALTAAGADALVLSLDRRATATYTAAKVAFELLD
jgi:predicted nucleic acid-binding protein